ncbi:MAG: glycosyltransferase [Azospirillum sp.]|nr:glycosyltransferase [Azospirillum sp.]
MATRRTIIINWGVSSFYGWGVFGLNLALNWVSDPDIMPVCGCQSRADMLSIDALRAHVLEPFFSASTKFQDNLKHFAGGPVRTNTTVLSALGNQLQEGARAAHDTGLSGKPSLGVVFFEQTTMDQAALDRAAGYDLIICGSTWNERILRAHGLSRVCTVIQGIDPTLFHPAPRAGLGGDRFLIFSGGKLELRKGQDIVLAAFKIFAARHPEAYLAVAWQNPWPDLVRTMNHSRLTPPVPLRSDGSADLKAWVADAGVPTDRVIDLGKVANGLMPPILREIDVALFPNRCEGGTNLVAMECMACGVPVILSRNTGHLDLIEDDNCGVLEEQRALTGPGAPVGDVAGWGVSSVDEAVERLEEVWADRATARARAERAAKQLTALTWADTAARLKKIMLDFA